MKSKFLNLFVFMCLSVFVPIYNSASYGWGFSRNSNHNTPDVGKYYEEIADTNSYYVGNSEEKCVYLTFDAGYDNGNLEKILSVLEEKEVSATFFLTGDFIVRESELVLKITESGHTVGNHTWSHKNITSLDDKMLQSEITKVEEEYYKLTNKELPKYFRPPAGCFNKEALKKISQMGYSTIFWSIAYKDWDPKNQLGYMHSYNSVIDNLHNGAIILMHTVSTDNVEALPKIIDTIRAQGYEIKTLDYLKSSSK